MDACTHTEYKPILTVTYQMTLTGREMAQFLMFLLLERMHSFCEKAVWPDFDIQVDFVQTEMDNVTS